MIDKKDGKRIKARELKPSVKKLIFSRAISQKNVPREFLANDLIKEIAESGEVPPALETAKRYISKARNMDNTLDKPWTISCCSEYGQYFQPESIPILIEYRRYYENELDPFPGKSGKLAELTGIFKWQVIDEMFSIRHCIWIIRLKPLVEKIFKDIMEKNENFKIGYTIMIANWYMAAEFSSGAIGEDKFDSTDLDRSLISGDIHGLARASLGVFLKSRERAKCDYNCGSQCTKAGEKGMPCEGKFHKVSKVERIIK